MATGEARIRKNPYPTREDPDFDPTWDLRFEVPKGYANWTDYTLAVLDAKEQGGEGPIPYTVYDQPMYDVGESGVHPYTFLVGLGYGDFASRLDTTNPKIREFLDNLHFMQTGTDEQSFFGDQFSTALLGLGLATGGAALLGGFGAGGAGAASGAGAIGGETAFGAGGAGSGFLSGAGGAGAAGALGGGAGLAGAGGAASGLVGGAGGAGAAAAGGGGTLAGIPWGDIIGAAASIGGGLLQDRSAARAVGAQQDAAREANALLAAIYNQQREDMVPYRHVGLQALDQLNKLTQQPMQFTPYTYMPDFDVARYDPRRYLGARTGPMAR